jgi:uncharacterized DUF497 family protein
LPVDAFVATILFEWDDDKNAMNIAKHGLSFDRASRVFDDVVLTVQDDRRDYGETRSIRSERLMALLSSSSPIRTEMVGSG